MSSSSSPATSGLTAALAVAAGLAAAVGAYEIVRLRAERAKLERSLKLARKSRSSHASSLAQDMGAEIQAEQLSRNRQFFGDKGQDAVEGAFVVVVGLGGVGSHAAHMLARAGVARLRLVDFDNVTPSSLNRHAVATRRDVGTPKVDACKAHFLETCPHLEIETCSVMYTARTEEQLLCAMGGAVPDFVLDCIDDPPTKVDLLGACQRRKLRVMSAQGAGAKADPTRLHIGALGDALLCPLALKVRTLLRKRAIPDDGITAIYSSETARHSLLPLTKEQKDEGAHNFGAMDQTRTRIIPVLGCMPAAMGMAMASFCLTELAGKSIDHEAVPLTGLKNAQKLLVQLQVRWVGSGGSGGSGGSMPLCVVVSVLNSQYVT